MWTVWIFKNIFPDDFTFSEPWSQPHQIVQLLLRPHVDDFPRVLLRVFVLEPGFLLFISIFICGPVILADVLVPGLELVERRLEDLHSHLLGHIQGHLGHEGRRERGGKEDENGQKERDKEEWEEEVEK